MNVKIPPKNFPPFDEQFGSEIRWGNLNADQKAVLQIFCPTLKYYNQEDIIPFFRRIPQNKASRVKDIVAEIARENGQNLPNDIFIMQSNTTYACCVQGDDAVILSQGTLLALDDDELRSVLRHEMRHLTQDYLSAVHEHDDHAEKWLHLDEEIPELEPATPGGIPFPSARRVLDMRRYAEIDAISAEVETPEDAEITKRTIEKMTRWDNILAGRSSLDPTKMDKKRNTPITYEHWLRPRAQQYLREYPEAIECVEKYNWEEFNRNAPTDVLFKVQDVLDVLTRDKKAGATKHVHEDRGILAHPPLVQQAELIDRVAEKQRTGMGV